MFRQFMKNKKDSSFGSIAFKVIPLILILPVILLFLFVGRLETIFIMGGVLIAFYVVYFGKQTFIKVKKKFKEAKNQEMI